MDLTIEQIKAISIVDYLSRYGYKVQKFRETVLVSVPLFLIITRSTPHSRWMPI
jgi:hypothetical protein